MRRRRPDEQERATTSTASRATAAPAGLLALQQSAGNQAVSRMLARQAADAGPAGAKADYTVELPMIAIVPTSEVVGMGEQKEAGPTGKELTVRFTSPNGAHVDPLMKWVKSGRPVKRMFVHGPQAAWELHEVVGTEMSPPPSEADGTYVGELEWTVRAAHLERTG